MSFSGFRRFFRRHSYNSHADMLCASLPTQTMQRFSPIYPERTLRGSCYSRPRESLVWSMCSSDSTYRSQRWRKP